MANLPETATYDPGVYQIETTDPVQGGTLGIDNKSATNLANRTAYLKAHVDALEGNMALYALINSPAFTGSPTAPTPAAGDNTTKLATTAFVQALKASIATVSVAGSSNVTLTSTQYGGGIIALTGALTGNINVIFPSQVGSWFVLNETTGAFTITLKTAAAAGVVIAQGRNRGVLCDGTKLYAVHSDYDSVALTGTPTAPTPATADASTKIATTAFVQNLVAGLTTAFASASDVQAGSSSTQAITPAALSGAGSFAQVFYGSTETGVSTTSPSFQTAANWLAITKRRASNKVFWFCTMQFVNDVSSSGGGAGGQLVLVWDTGSGQTPFGAAAAARGIFGGSGAKWSGVATKITSDNGSLPQSYNISPQFCSPDSTFLNMQSCTLIGIEIWA